jgi:hypothetical protein
MVIIEGFPVGGNGALVGLIITPPFVCVSDREGIIVGVDVAVLNGTMVGVAVGVSVGIAVGDGEGVSVGVNDMLGVGVTEGAGGLVCCPAA